MNRRKELLTALNTDEKLVGHLVDEVIYLENQIEEVKKLPFIKVHPDDPQKQKSTPAAKLYTQLCAQYNSAIRTLVSIANGNGTTEEESPLRKWVKNFSTAEVKHGGIRSPTKNPPAER